MKPISIIILILLPQCIFSQEVIYYQSFENSGDNWSYFSNPNPFYEPTANWGILDESFYVFTSLPSEGEKFWGIQDLYSPQGTSSWGMLSFENIPINNYNSVVLTFDFECKGFDTNDDMKYQIIFDGIPQEEVVFVDGYANLDTSGTVTISIPNEVESFSFALYAKQNGSIDYGAWDNIKLTGELASTVFNPSLFCTLTGANQATFYISSNQNNDELIIVYNNNNEFTSPFGNLPEIGDSFAGGIVIYRGFGSVVNYTLAYNQQYFYKAFSYNQGEYSIGVSQSLQSLKAEPENHASNFRVISTSPSSFELNWDYLQGEDTADGFILEAVLDNNFVDLIEGTPPDGYTYQENGELLIVLDAEIVSVMLTNLHESAEYFIKLIPFSNSGYFTKYKSDEDAPILQAPTFDKGNLIFSEIADPADWATGRFVELFNSSEYDLNFEEDLWYVCRQANGATWGCVQLSGRIEAGDCYVIAYSASIYLDVYGQSPDIFSGIISGNGDDGYFLYYGGNYMGGELIDAYGELYVHGIESVWNYTDGHAVRKHPISEGQSIYNPDEWIIQGGNAISFTPGRHHTYWNGQTSDQWNNPSNWSIGVPGQVNTAIIEADSDNFPVVSEMDTIKRLVLQAGAELIQHQLLTTTDYSEMQLSIPPWSNENDGWKLLSSPISSFAIVGSEFIQDEYDFYAYDEPENIWLNQKNSDNNEIFQYFASGQSYLVAFGEEKNTSFRGQFHSGNIHFDNLSKLQDGWHLMGNPFPASIAWNTTEWMLDAISPYAYLLNSSGTAYELVFPGDLIPPLAGFWVRAIQNPGHLTIPIPSLNQTTKAKCNTKETVIGLRLVCQNIEYQTFFQENNQASFEFDPNLDAKYLAPLSEQAIEMYSLDAEGNALALNSFPFKREVKIPLQISSTQVCVVTLSANYPESENKRLKLYDRQNEEYLVLNKEASFSISLSPNDMEERFCLEFHEQALFLESIELQELMIQLNSSSFSFSIPKNEYALKLEILTIQGKSIRSKDISTNSSINLSENIASGIYLLQLQTNLGVYSQKITLTD